MVLSPNFNKLLQNLLDTEREKVSSELVIEDIHLERS